MVSLLEHDSDKDIVIYINDCSPQFVPALRKLSQKLDRPLRCILLVDAERKASGNYLSDKENFFEEIVVDFFDDGALRKVIKSLEDRLLIVGCDSEASQLYFKRVIPHVPYVRTPTEGSLVFSTDKGKMRELFLSYDEKSSPKAIVVGDATDESVRKICEKLEFPVMIKPTSLIASLLVNKANDKEELRQILESNFIILNEMYLRRRSLSDKKMIVEEFVEGDLFSTDIYVDDVGKVYVLPFVHFQNGATVGMNSYQVYQSETFHTLSAEEEQAGGSVAKTAVHALGLRSTVAHVELFHTTSGWKIIELGARSGGRRQDMYNISYGIDHAFNDLLNKIGIEPEMPSPVVKVHSTTFKVHTPAAGILESIEGVDEARMHPNMHSIRSNLKPGEKALPSTLGGVELVDGLMYNSDHEQLDRDIAAIRDSITVHIQ